MNLADYVDANLSSLSRKKKKNMIRKINNKLRAMQPRILEAKILGYDSDHKVYRYKIRLESSLRTLEQNLAHD